MTAPPLPPQAPPTSGSTRGEWIVLFTLAAVQFTSIVDFMIVMPLGPQLLEALSIDTARFGWIVSSYTFAAGAAGLIAAAVLDRFGRKVVFLSLYVGFIIGTLLCGLATTFSQLLAARIVTGAFGGVLGGQAMAIVGDLFPDERRGRATGALMSAFAVASVVGVPAGIVIGNRFGWHVPFLLLAGLSLPLLAVALWTMPPLAGHIARLPPHPLVDLRDTLTRPAHLRAFALISLLMVGAFSVIPFISTSYVANAGVAEAELPIIFISGGLLTLVGAPVIGRLSDRHGKLAVLRWMVPISALMMLVITHLPRVGIAWAAVATALLMLANTGRMVAAMALVTSSVEARRRAGFMSANSSVQHVACGLGTEIGGMIIRGEPGQPMLHYDTVGWFAAAVTLASLWIAGRIRPVSASSPTTLVESLAAAAEAQVDAGEALAAIEVE